jgi:membrane protein DedA with SNARE-associated domain
VQHFLASWGYLAIFVLSLISSFGIPVGAEVAVIFGGVLASGHGGSTHHPLDVVLVIVAATAAELIGSFAGYLLGRGGGRPLVERLGKYVLLSQRDLDRAEAWFARRGDLAVLFGRFIPLLRSFVSIAAGLGEMAITKFAVFTFIGCAVWCTALALLGDSLGSSYNHVLNDFSDAGYVAGALFVVVVAALIVHRVRQVRAAKR